jgi:hypothetical protein
LIDVQKKEEEIDLTKIEPLIDEILKMFKVEKYVFKKFFANDKKDVKGYIAKNDKLLTKLNEASRQSKASKEWRQAQETLLRDAKIVFSTLSMVGSKKF